MQWYIPGLQEEQRRHVTLFNALYVNQFMSKEKKIKGNFGRVLTGGKIMVDLP